jgi:hypothetical protein
MLTGPHVRVRRAPRSLTATQLAAEQLAELAQQRDQIDKVALSSIAKANAQISSALARRDHDAAELDRLVAAIDQLRSGRPVIARDDYSGPRVEVYHYLDGECDKRPARGRIMFEPQALAINLRSANCRCRFRVVAE